MKALIGHSGFVGSTLLRQQSFDALFGSSNIEDAPGQSFDAVICAAAPAQKWKAEQDPGADLANIERLIRAVIEIEAKRFILISTVDVYDDSRGKTEADRQAPTSAYGSNRLYLEDRVRARFPEALIVRLPGLVGPGLRKNAVFDFLNDNNLHLIDHRAQFQLYPMVNLTADLETAVASDLRTVNFACEPMSIAEVADCFGRPFDNTIDGRAPAQYDLHTRHALDFGGAGPYLYDKRSCALAIRAYAQSEPQRPPLA